MGLGSDTCHPKPKRVFQKQCAPGLSARRTKLLHRSGPRPGLLGESARAAGLTQADRLVTSHHGIDRDGLRHGRRIVPGTIGPPGAGPGHWQTHSDPSLARRSRLEAGPQAPSAAPAAASGGGGPAVRGVTAPSRPPGGPGGRTLSGGRGRGSSIPFGILLSHHDEADSAEATEIKTTVRLLAQTGIVD